MKLKIYKYRGLSILFIQSIYRQYFSGFIHIGRKTECDGEEIFIGAFDSVTECAYKCRGLSTLFAFGTKRYEAGHFTDFESGGFKCLCETSAKADGTCKRVPTQVYELYMYANPDTGNSYPVVLTSCF